MHSTPAKTLLAFALAAALAFPGAAAAATKTYGGTTDSGGKIAIDAVVKQAARCGSPRLGPSTT